MKYPHVKTVGGDDCFEPVVYCRRTALFRKRIKGLINLLVLWSDHTLAVSYKL